MGTGVRKDQRDIVRLRWVRLQLRAEPRRYDDRSSAGSISGSNGMSDELNPAFTFNLTATPLLVLLLKDPARLYELASEQLASRGLDINGKWVGFEKP